MITHSEEVVGQWNGRDIPPCRVDIGRLPLERQKYHLDRHRRELGAAIIFDGGSFFVTSDKAGGILLWYEDGGNCAITRIPKNTIRFYNKPKEK